MSHSDFDGGAARAAYRIHKALISEGGNSHMWVNTSSGRDWTVKGPSTKLEKAMTVIRAQLGALVTLSLKTTNPIVHSPAIVASNWTKRINQSDADIVHLHWVQKEMLSIGNIGCIRKPIVWTLHDMWAFCGAEHYTQEFRWREGYKKSNRPNYESGFDLNRWVWERKRKYWQNSMHIVTPSRWLASCVKQSALMQEWPVTVIPNPIDIQRWQPVEKSLARALLDLPMDVPLLLFGAIGGGHDSRKGFDLLQSALQHIHSEMPELELVVFGQLAPKNPPDFRFSIHYVGHLNDDLSLRVLYSAADAFVLPSRQDNLPNTGVEALACGTPVVAFDVCGLPDIVSHQKTGYLASPFDVEDLARGIKWVLDDRERNISLGLNARAAAVERFSYEKVAHLYTKVYKLVCHKK